MVSNHHNFFHGIGLISVGKILVDFLTEPAGFALYK